MTALGAKERIQSLVLTCSVEDSQVQGDSKVAKMKFLPDPSLATR